MMAPAEQVISQMIGALKEHEAVMIRLLQKLQGQPLRAPVRHDLAEGEEEKEEAKQQQNERDNEDKRTKWYEAPEPQKARETVEKRASGEKRAAEEKNNAEEKKAAEKKNAEKEAAEKKAAEEAMAEADKQAEGPAACEDSELIGFPIANIRWNLKEDHVEHRKKRRLKARAGKESESTGKVVEGGLGRRTSRCWLPHGEGRAGGDSK